MPKWMTSLEPGSLSFLIPIHQFFFQTRKHSNLLCQCCYTSEYSTFLLYNGWHLPWLCLSSKVTCSSQRNYIFSFFIFYKNLISIEQPWVSIQRNTQHCHTISPSSCSPNASYIQPHLHMECSSKHRLTYEIFRKKQEEWWFQPDCSIMCSFLLQRIIRTCKAGFAF